MTSTNTHELTRMPPDAFEVRDDVLYVLYVMQEELDDSLRSKVEIAARRCPKQAITAEG